VAGFESARAAHDAGRRLRLTKTLCVEPTQRSVFKARRLRLTKTLCVEPTERSVFKARRLRPKKRLYAE
jgi:hypothetical protein